MSVKMAVTEGASCASCRKVVVLTNRNDPEPYRLALAIGWPAKGVDALARRSHLEGRVWAGAEYAWFVENGTSRMAAQPYMGPSFERHSAKWLTAMQRLGAQAVHEGSVRRENDRVRPACDDGADLHGTGHPRDIDLDQPLLLLGATN